ncbi:MAG: hypothetical protein RSE00_00555 [Clostridia bacterium]
MFESIIGHKENKEILENTIDTGNISHAYLFAGQKGIGKSLIAFEFAKKILKTDNLESNPDYKYICKLDEKKGIIVDQIRKEVIDDIYISPAIGDRKVYIIDDARKFKYILTKCTFKNIRRAS